MLASLLVADFSDTLGGLWFGLAMAGAGLIAGFVTCNRSKK
jgi:hypothetical protein